MFVVHKAQATLQSFFFFNFPLKLQSELISYAAFAPEEVQPLPSRSRQSIHGSLIQAASVPDRIWKLKVADRGRDCVR